MATQRFIIDGKEYQVDVGLRSGNRVAVTVNGRRYEVELPGPAAGAPAPRPADQPAARPNPAAAAATAAHAPASPAAGGEVRAPISGVVLSLDVAPGARVAVGARLLVLEAMKMENDIFAPCAGVVASVAVQPQDQVSTGDLLVTITPD